MCVLLKRWSWFWLLWLQFNYCHVLLYILDSFCKRDHLENQACLKLLSSQWKKVNQPLSLSFSLSLSLTHTHIYIYTHTVRNAHTHTHEFKTVSEVTQACIWHLLPRYQWRKSKHSPIFVVWIRARLETFTIQGKQTIGRCRGGSVGGCT